MQVPEGRSTPPNIQAPSAAEANHEAQANHEAPQANHEAPQEDEDPVITQVCFCRRCSSIVIQHHKQIMDHLNVASF